MNSQQLAHEIVRGAMADLKGPFLTQKQMAEMFGVSVETIAKWRVAGKFYAVKLNHRTIRIPQSEVDRLLKVKP